MLSENFAVIRVKVKQYKVAKGDIIFIDKTEEKKIEPEVLLLAKDNKIEVVNPLLPKSKVSVKILEEIVKGEKIHILKYKAKSRYRKKIGFRPLYTKLQIENIA